MRYLPLGPTGVLVSELCLGTMTFGDGWGFGGIDEAQADAIVGKAMDAGINFLDTADMYSEGQSEILLGKALSKGERRNKVVLATKAFGRMGPSANDAGLSRYHLVRACEASLERLGTDRIDLYQVHGLDALTPIEETVRALDDLVKSGKVLYVGLCNYAAWQIALALGKAESAGHRAVRQRPDVLQPRGPRRRARGRPALPSRRPRDPAVEPAGRRLPVGQVPTRPGAAPRGEPVRHQQVRRVPAGRQGEGLRRRRPPGRRWPSGTGRPPRRSP